MAIVGQLQARLSPQEKTAIDQAPTTDVAAYDLFLRAQDLFERNSGPPLQGGDKLAQAVPLLEQALARDPQFLAAWCLLARVQGVSLPESRTTRPRAWSSSAPPCRGPCAWPPTRARRTSRWPTTTTSAATTRQTAAELALAGRTLPNESRVPELTGYMLRRQGRWDEAVRSMEEALALDPRNFVLLGQLANSYAGLRRYADHGAHFTSARWPSSPATRSPACN